ncbi:hypothetical protein NE237_028136 [Protea cynaroides]|uniref:Phosphofructokinase domain-containing protein n=1 Tax=Protea cynaroides TaxID=273540 RepID=A0A9Q0JSK3_9MAGN|nr:hypothetical protein NE237_028136 [Protea cynaroides]
MYTNPYFSLQIGRFVNPIASGSGSGTILGSACLLLACFLKFIASSYKGGFVMIYSGRNKIETPEQFKQAEETAVKLKLNGLVVIGGDDSNTNACILAENFRNDEGGYCWNISVSEVNKIFFSVNTSFVIHLYAVVGSTFGAFSGTSMLAKKVKTQVIGCPKTIDGDLKFKEVPISFGFDTACKIYAEMIGNVMIDARSTRKYYNFQEGPRPKLKSIMGQPKEPFGIDPLDQPIL